MEKNDYSLEKFSFQIRFLESGYSAGLWNAIKVGRNCIIEKKQKTHLDILYKNSFTKVWKVLMEIWRDVIWIIVRLGARFDMAIRTLNFYVQ